MIQFYFSLREAVRLIDALRSSKGDAPADPADRQLAATIERTLERDREAAKAAAREAAHEAEVRAKRAENHTLTERQAEALSAVRAGKSPYFRPQIWMGTLTWRSSRSMGGAVRRMIDLLIDEGLLTPRGTPPGLTPAGLTRLEAYEAKHGRVGPE